MEKTLPRSSSCKTQGNKETTSCAGCAYLYAQDEGYSNYTVTETVVHCALDRNPLLLERGSEESPIYSAPNQMGYDWTGYDDRYENDNWVRTNNSRCEMYFVDIGKKVDGIPTLDVDGDVKPEDLTENAYIVETIKKHAGL